jgi:hypothetical protein
MIHYCDGKSSKVQAVPPGFIGRTAFKLQHLCIVLYSTHYSRAGTLGNRARSLTGKQGVYDIFTPAPRLRVGLTYNKKITIKNTGGGGGGVRTLHVSSILP